MVAHFCGHLVPSATVLFPVQFGAEEMAQSVRVFGKREDVSSNLYHLSTKPGMAVLMPITPALWGAETGEALGLHGLQYMFRISTFSERFWLKGVRQRDGAEHPYLPVAAMCVHKHHTYTSHTDTYLYTRTLLCMPDCPQSQAIAILGSSAVPTCKRTFLAGLVDCLQPLVEGVRRVIGPLEHSLSLPPVACNAVLTAYGSREGLEDIGPGRLEKGGSIFEAIGELFISAG